MLVKESRTGQQNGRPSKEAVSYVAQPNHRHRADGGWAFRHGPEAVAGDKFKLGPKLENGVLLLGRKTWELFAQIWPSRTDDFSAAMNRVPKVVASLTRPDLSAWSNSTLMDGELIEAAEQLTSEHDVIVAGSASVVHALAAADRVDEYRVLFFPSALGSGTRLFTTESTPADFRQVSAETSGQAILARYERLDD